uniref:Uncharacterized protein n=2 Tax=Strigamia maritima TaxID=126957 RepID=T1JCU7_STRMM
MQFNNYHISELKIRECLESEFQCNNGQCIPQEDTCYDSGNAEQGCADGSHLIHCRNWECPSNLHKCLYGNCISKYLVCNGQVDCWDSWNDEIGCPFKCSSEVRCECRDVMINCTNIGLEALPTNIEKEISKYIFSGNQFGPILDAKMFKLLDGVILLDLSNNSILAIPPE